MLATPWLLRIAALAAAAIGALAFTVHSAAGQDPGSGGDAEVQAGDSCLHLRDAPGLQSEVQDCLLTGVGLNLLGDRESLDGHTWARVETVDGSTGWVATEFIATTGDSANGATTGREDVPAAEQGATATVDTGGSCLYARQHAGIHTSILTCLPDGSRVTVLGDATSHEGYAWVPVELPGGTNAWMAADFLVFESADSGPSATPASEVIGHSVQGRPIEAFTLGDGPNTVVLVGGVHTGLEAPTVDLVQALWSHFRDGHSPVPSDVTLVVVPNTNPDGYALGTRVNARGVDLNRNWPSSDWSPEAFHGATPVSGGTAPMSEPETEAVYSYLLGLAPDIVLSYHGYASVVDDNHVGAASSLGSVYASAAGYEHIHEWGHYEITGELITAMGEAGIAAADIELARADAHFDRNLAGVRAVLDAVSAQ